MTGIPLVPVLHITDPCYSIEMVLVPSDVALAQPLQLRSEKGASHAIDVQYTIVGYWQTLLYHALLQKLSMNHH